MAACFAARGFQVHAVDIDPGKVAAINSGVAPVHEPGLDELIRESAGFLKASGDVEAAVRESDATFIYVRLGFGGSPAARPIAASNAN
jgi:UDP-glucose 6-dehydrogenase